MRHLRVIVLGIAAVTLVLAGCRRPGLVGVTGITIIDSGNNRVVNVSDMACNNWTTYNAAGFASPWGVSLDTQGRVNVTDRGANDRIVRIDSMTGAGLVTYGGTGSGMNQFNDPAGLRVDAQDVLFVADPGNNRVVSFVGVPGGGWVAYSTGLSAPMDVGWDSNTNTTDGKLYILDTGNHRIVRINGFGGNVTPSPQSFGGPGSGVGQFSSPRAIWVQGGVIYVADTGNDRIVSFNTSEFTSPSPPSWQAYAGAGDQALIGPSGIFVNANATQIFIADTGKHRIVRLQLPLPGTNFTACGAGPGSGVGQFNTPTDIVVNTGN